MPVTPGQATLASVRLAAARRADMEGSPFVSREEWDSYIESAAYELYDLLRQSYGDNYYVTDALLTVNGKTAPLPDDFRDLLGVDLDVGGRWRTLQPFNMNERNRYSPSGEHPRYQLRGDTLKFDTTPAGAVRVIYVPRLSLPTTDEGTFDGLLGREFIEFVTCTAALQAKQKEESDVSVLLHQKQALIKRIQSAAANRDAGQAYVVGSVHGSDDGWWL